MRKEAILSFECLFFILPGRRGCCNCRFSMSNYVLDRLQRQAGSPRLQGTLKRVSGVQKKGTACVCVCVCHNVKWNEMLSARAHVYVAWIHCIYVHPGLAYRPRTFQQQTLPSSSVDLGSVYTYVYTCEEMCMSMGGSQILSLSQLMSPVRERMSTSVKSSSLAVRAQM